MRIRRESKVFLPTKLQSKTIELFEILSKSEKSKQELEFIYSNMKTLSYFNPFIESFLKGTSKETIYDLCKHFYVETYKGGDIIFKEGDVSNNKLYLIWSGSVLLLRKKKLEVLQKEESYYNKLFSRKSSRMYFEMISDAEKTALIEQYGNILRELERGDGFGEKALIEQTCRTLTVAVSSLELDLIVLEKKHFRIVQKALEDSIQDKRLLVFNIFTSINEYSSVRLESMIYSFQSEEIEKNKIICLEEAQGERFFLIQQGEVKLTRRHIFEDGNYIDVPISLIGRGSLVGEEIVISKSYQYTVKIESLTATIMTISYQHFHAKFPEECKKCLLKIIHQRKKQRKIIFNEMVAKILKQKEELAIQRQQKSNMAQFSKFLQKITLNQRYDNTFSQFRNFIPLKSRLDFINSIHQQSGIVQNFEIDEILSKQETIMPKLESLPPSEQFDFGRGEVEWLEKQKKIFATSKSTRNKQNYIGSSDNLKFNLIKKKYMVSFSSHYDKKEFRANSLSQKQEIYDLNSPKQSFFQTSVPINDKVPLFIKQNYGISIQNKIRNRWQSTNLS